MEGDRRNLVGEFDTTNDPYTLRSVLHGMLNDVARATSLPTLPPTDSMLPLEKIHIATWKHTSHWITKVRLLIPLGVLDAHAWCILIRKQSSALLSKSQAPLLMK